MASFVPQKCSKRYIESYITRFACHTGRRRVRFTQLRRAHAFYHLRTRPGLRKQKVIYYGPLQHQLRPCIRAESAVYNVVVTLRILGFRTAKPFLCDPCHFRLRRQTLELEPS